MQLMMTFTRRMKMNKILNYYFYLYIKLVLTVVALIMVMLEELVYLNIVLGLMVFSLIMGWISKRHNPPVEGEYVEWEGTDDPIN